MNLRLQRGGSEMSKQRGKMKLTSGKGETKELLPSVTSPNHHLEETSVRSQKLLLAHKHQRDIFSVFHREHQRIDSR